MGRDSRRPTQPLDISTATTSDTPLVDPSSSPSIVKTPKSPRSPFRFSSKLQNFSTQQPMQGPEHQQKPGRQPASRTIETSASSLNSASASPVKGSLFTSYKGSNNTTNSKPASMMNNDSDARTNEGSVTPGKVSGADDDSIVAKSIVRRPVAAPSSESPRTNLSSSPVTSAPITIANNNRKPKPKPFSLMNRSRSIRSEQDGQSPGDHVPITITESSPRGPDYGGLRTAPLRTEQDRSHRDIMSSSAARNHSADRQLGSLRSTHDRDTMQGSSLKVQSGLSTSQRDNGGFLSGLKSSASKGVGIGRGVLGKFGRSHSTNEKEPVVDDANYVVRVLNLPLVQQTRITRIAKRLEESRDKTEFWMPAFPWRAIDYLNYRGTETEGLYRVPGSGPEIKKWQRRFDSEHDVDLFEQQDLYDINIIGSMLKSWLRELPDEILPKPIQDRVSREYGPGQDTVPQLLIDELSNLQPYNYYLLFAITCHLSLLLAHSEKNKMDFRNLCICFQPCMKIDATCFKYLVVDWAQCWKGCKTEDYWLEQEYMLFDQMPPSSAEGQSSTAIDSYDDRNISSSDSSQTPARGEPSTESSRTNQRERMKQPSLSTNQSKTSLNIEQETFSTPVKTSGNADPLQPLKPLSPIEPLSPMQF